VVGYNVYWICVIIGFGLMRFKETKGHLPFLKGEGQGEVVSESPMSGSGILETKDETKTTATVAPVLSREIS
jgi:high-affinity iron transporter